jgi:hypothetical protein
MSRLPQIVLAVACIAGGALLGRSTAETPRAPPRPAELSALPPGTGTVALRGDVLRADIRRVLREELQLARVPEPLQPRVVAEPTAPSPATPEAQAAAGQGRRIVQDALAARRWREQDVLAIRQVLPQISADDRDAMLRELIPAINNGRVALETVGEIF